MSELPVTYWHWLILGLLLLGGELLLPGIYLLWIGVAALITGILVALVPGMELLFQGVAFAVLVVGSAIVGRRVYGRREALPADATLNRRTAGYVGRVVVLDEPIANGRGRASINGTSWLVEGPDLPAGAQVRIVGSDGTVLRVEAQNH